MLQVINGELFNTMLIWPSRINPLPRQRIEVIKECFLYYRQAASSDCIISIRREG
jgi:hypothetical protein